jgi:hypothetical protein
MASKGSLNVARIAHRHLRQKPVPGPSAATAWARTANRFVVACNLIGLLAAAGLVAALFPLTIAGDCPAALLAGYAMRDIETVATSFVMGALLSGVPPALLGLIRFAAGFGRIGGESKRAADIRTLTAGWLSRDPVLFAIAAVLAAVLFVDGAGLLVRHVHARAHWPSNATLRDQVAATCAELASVPSKP